MSVKIRIEMRNEEGIFTTTEVSKVDLARMLCEALESMAPEDILGPYPDSGAQVFILTVADPREHWVKAKRSLQEQTLDTD